MVMAKQACGPVVRNSQGLLAPRFSPSGTGTNQG